jgi:hypothetical protein
MSQRKPRKAKPVTYHVIPVFFLDVAEPFRIPHVEDIEALNVPDYVQQCMRELLGNIPEPYKVSYIQVIPKPSGYRAEDVIGPVGP